jgi:hypothetical protein
MFELSQSKSAITAEKRAYIHQSLNMFSTASTTRLKIDEFVNPETRKIVDIFHRYEAPEYKIHMQAGRTTKCCATGTCMEDTGAIFCPHSSTTWLYW